LIVTFVNPTTDEFTRTPSTESPVLTGAAIASNSKFVNVTPEVRLLTVKATPGDVGATTVFVDALKAQLEQLNPP
jgi:hypothetical protein